MNDHCVAALFVQPNGVYSTMPEVDLWPLDRDARGYKGTQPVVAHPPCQRWGNLGAINYLRWRGDHNRPGNDNGCFASALASVNRWGGLLEHPAGSHAWSTFGLPPPYKRGWNYSRGAWVCEVWQSAYGHKAQKRSWLFYCGTFPPADLCWDRVAGTHQVGRADQRGKYRNKPHLSQRESNATPPAFARSLVSLALGAHSTYPVPSGLAP